MKTLLRNIIVAFMILVASGAYAATIAPSGSIPDNIQTEKNEKLINRLEEIKNMDKKNLTKDQKRILRHEVVSIKHQLHDGGGIYISVGAAIIIVILLIILL